MLKIYKINTVLYFLITAQVASAQIKVVPIPRKQPVFKSQGWISKEHSIVLELPFWDDFSKAKNVPDTALWIDSENVNINNTFGKNAPSIGVASFDGLDAFGTPYSLNAVEVGFVDSLTSKPIDLSKVPANQTNSVYLSFFFQKGGNGELPDDDDFIQLEFLSPESQWMVVWPQQISDLLTVTDIFTRTMIQVPDSLLHDQFQFRFRTFGRQSGPFDNWNLDYVFLDQGRNINDIYFPDRAVTTPLPSIYQSYTAYPIHQFQNGNQLGFRNISSFVFNHEDPANIVQAGDFTAYLRNAKTREIIDTLNYRDSELFSAQQSNEIFINPIDSTTLANALFNMDSLFLELELFINANDNFFVSSIDPVTQDTTFNTRFTYAVNDTVRGNFIFHDFQAYDDGSAEFGAGVNQAGGQIAYQFSVSSPDTLVSIDMYFPNINGSAAGTPINLFVLKDLGETTQSSLFNSSLSVQSSSAINQYRSYSISPAIVVQDTFYIGYQQNTNEFVPLGLDVNTNTANKIYFNVAGAWEMNTEIIGSLMMRPRFGPGDTVTGIDEKIIPKLIDVYPNPTSGQVYIEGDTDYLKIIDLFGRELNVNITGDYRKLVNLQNVPDGFYLIKAVKGTNLQIVKLILKR